LLVLLLVGCDPAPGAGFSAGTVADDDDAAEDPGPLWTPDDLPPCPQGDCVEPGLGVTWSSDSGREAPCREGDACDEDYRAFLLAAAAFSEPWGPGELAAAVAAIEAGEVPLEGPPQDLDARVREALGLSFLFGGLDSADHNAVEIGGESHSWGTATQWLVDDPWVGEFEFWLLMPGGEAPFAGVVAYPGHGETVLDHRQVRFGDQLAAAGFAIAVASPRAYDAWTVESALTQDLLQDGFSLLGLRVYELLLMHKLLRAHPQVHPTRIATMGHSGGSLGAVLASHLEPELVGVVLDLRSDFHNVSNKGIWLDETIPELFPLHEHVFDFDRYALATYEDDYGFPAGRSPIERSLGDWLWAP